MSESMWNSKSRVNWGPEKWTMSGLVCRVPFADREGLLYRICGEIIYVSSSGANTCSWCMIRLRTSSKTKVGLTRHRACFNFRSSSEQYSSPLRACTRKQNSHPFSSPAACIFSAARYLPRIFEGIMIALVKFSLSRRICNLKSSSSHEGRVGFEVLETEERANLSGQSTQIFDGPTRMSRNDSKHEIRSSRRSFRYLTRSRSARPSNRRSSLPRLSNVKG